MNRLNNTCNHDCIQGRSCNCYRINFDELGQPVEQKSPLTIADFLISLLSVLCIVALVSGVLRVGPA